MNRFLTKILLCVALIYTLKVSAEIIENKKITDRAFGMWNVSCREDVMLNSVKCRLFAELTKDTTVFINPQNTTKNQLLIISNDAVFDTKMMLKVDSHPLVESLVFDNNKYKVVNFKDADKKKIFAQMQNGEYFFVRFTVRDAASFDGKKEITVRLNLAELNKAIVYYETMVNKYNNIINK